MVMKKYLFVCLCGLFLSAQCSKKRIDPTTTTQPTTTTKQHVEVAPPLPATTPMPPPSNNTTQTVETPPPALSTKTATTNTNTNDVMQYYTPVWGRIPDPRLTQCYRTMALEIGVEWIQFNGKLLPQHIEANKATDTILRQKQGDNWQKDLEAKVEKCRNQP
jgi:hypothetical protein